MRLPTGRWGAWLTGLVLAWLLAGATYIVCDSLLYRVPMPVQLNYIEGFVLDEAQRLANGESIYGDPRRPPYTVSVYAPVYLVILAGLMHVGAPGLAAGRAVSYLSAIGVALVIGLLGYHRTGWIAVAAALLFLTQPVLWPWGIIVKPDMAAVLFSVIGVAIVARWGGRPTVYAALPFLLAALFTRQSAIAAVGACVADVGVRRPGRALLFAAVFIGVAALIGVSLQLATHGQFLFHTIVANQSNPFAWTRVALLGSMALARQWPEALGVVLLLLVHVRRRQMPLCGLYALLALLTSLTVGKQGSDLNYFIEPVAATLLFVAYDFPRDWFAVGGTTRRAFGAVAIVAVAVVAAAHVLFQYQRRAALPQMYAGYTQLRDRIAAQPGVVVSDDAILLLQARKPVYFSPFIMTQLAEGGLWDQTPFLDDLATQRIRLIVAVIAPSWLHATRYTASMRQLISERYSLEATYQFGFTYGVFAPSEALPRSGRRVPR